MSQVLHWHTSNTALAQALLQCGAKLLDVWNIYAKEQLQKLGCSARDAWQKGQPGRVTYYFENTPELHALLKAWDEEQAQIEAGSNVTLDITPEEAMRVACIVLKQRNQFASLWKQYTPKVEIQNEGLTKRIQEGDGVRIELPGFRLISINASDEKKKHLGLSV